jgi:hypothetical protein
LTVHRQTCGDCGRTVYASGQMRIIEAARISEGIEPVEAFLRGLETSRKGRSAQKNTLRLADIAIRIETYARTGNLETPRELNDLRDGLREIKAGDVRLPFYELIDENHLAMIARLTSGFFKGTQETPRKQIAKGLWVMREDGYS